LSVGFCTGGDARATGESFCTGGDARATGEGIRTGGDARATGVSRQARGLHYRHHSWACESNCTGRGAGEPAAPVPTQSV